MKNQRVRGFEAEKLNSKEEYNNVKNCLHNITNKINKALEFQEKRKNM